MRYLLLFIVCFASQVAFSQPKELLGNWMPMKQEFAGKPVAKAYFENQKLIIGDGTYIVIAESTDKGTVTYNGNKLDIYGTEGINKGKHFMAIYSLEKGELTICYNLAGDSYPESMDTKGKPMYFLSVFKKGE
jgi:uncharacterized protein (TIGR03067 family)